MDELAAFPNPDDDWDALAAIFRATATRSMLPIGWHLHPDHPLAAICGATRIQVRDGGLTHLTGHDDLPDAVAIGGYLTWHHARHELNRIASVYSGRAHLPLIVIALDNEDPVPAWPNYAERYEQARRLRLRRAGVELAVRTFASERSPELEILWPGGARRIAVLLGSETSSSAVAGQRDVPARPDPALDTGAFSPEPLGEFMAIDEVRPPSTAFPSVTYVLPVLSASGGVLSVLQLANELFLLGADVRIASVRVRNEIFRWRFLREPLVFRNAADLVESLPACDLVVATHWTTAEWVRDIVASGRARHGAYLLQDYEAWFFPETDVAARDKVRETYNYFEHKIVKSGWLRGLLRNDGHAPHKIALGMDLGFFFPRPVERPPRPIVVAMARPRTPRRGFEWVVRALQIVKQEVPDIEIAFFGEDLSGLSLPFPFRNEEIVTDQQRLALLYSSATVHLDGSNFQAFGRPALEAMACGVASVLTDVGGVSEYARHEENCLLVPPREPTAFAEAIIRLLRDPGLRERLRQAGFATVLNYCAKREARETLALFREICGATPLPMPAMAAAAL